MTTAVFTQGSTLKHILVMTLANAVGLVTLFFVDLVDMYFLSLLGEKELAAAVGFAGTLLFFLTSICIGLSIAMGSNVARSIGSNDRDRAKLYVTNTLIYSSLLIVIVTVPCVIWQVELLQFLGASGKTLEYAHQYTSILLPTTVVIGVAMGLASSLRGVGDAKHSMYAILGGGAANAILDPILIFTFDMGIEGAAWASVAARFTILFMAGYSVLVQHKLLGKFEKNIFIKDYRAIFSVAGPAMLTNLATPIGSSYVMKSMAEFGDSAVAGAAIVGRIVPVAFGVLFALSGSIGPVVGQNMGAHEYGRVRSAVFNAMMFAVVYSLITWAALYLFRFQLVGIFDAKNEAAHLMIEFCSWISLGFVFNGFLFVANATFNNIGAAQYATVSSFARSLLGTIPLVYILSREFGAVGVMAGEIAGALVFGSLALWIAFRKINKIEKHYLDTKNRDAKSQENKDLEKGATQELNINDGLVGQLPFSSEKSILGQEIIDSCSQENIDKCQDVLQENAAGPHK